MLAGYLPFDDDPANPDGDNINLLYKYITTTPLTFPEYVSPHARDLLRRILVPDPRKRADLFEVARHSWLSEYHRVVSHITSSTTNIADITNSTVLSGKSPAFANIAVEPLDSPILNRSASVREPSKPTGNTPKISPSQQQGKYVTGEEREAPSTKSQKSTRHTLQPEYIAPQTHTTRGPAPASADAPSAATGSRGDNQGKILFTSSMASESKPLPQPPPIGSPSPEEYMAAEAMQLAMAPPARPPKDASHSVPDSTGAFSTAPQPTTHQVTRPSTRGSLTSASGPMGTKSDLRLPSRGSYGQPVAPTVATTNAQGKVTQPGKSTRGYNISGPIPQHAAQNSIGQPMSQPIPLNNTESISMPPPQAGKGHHRRTSTLSGLGEKLFGRSGSVLKKRESDGPRQKNGKKYPPSAMKEPYTSDGPRPSVDSKRSFSFGLGKKRSTDLESQSEKPGRRFSLIPGSISFKGLIGGGSRDQLANTASPQTPQTADFPQPPTNTVPSRPDTGTAAYLQYAQNTTQSNTDGQQELPRQAFNNFSRPPQSQQYQQQPPQPTSQPSDDVYGGTGVYAPPSHSQYQDRNYQQREPFRPQYPEGFDSQPRRSTQQGRQGKGVLTKSNRKFTDENDHHTGSSGAVKKVQEFFRRRAKARVDGSKVEVWTA
jgi:protein-serine/threonine kinase